MEITEIRIKLMEDPSERLQAFCSITFDRSFVIRDLKIIQGTKGSFVAMPSRKLMDRCPRCSSKNQLRARYCNDCGAKLHEDRACKGDDGRARLYADIAHPINSDCRELIQRSVLDAYGLELVKSKQPGYVCTYDDFGEDDYARLSDEEDIDDGATLPFRQNGDTYHRRDGAGHNQSPHIADQRQDGRHSREGVFTTSTEGFGEGIV